MPQFEDRANRKWNVQLDVLLVEEIKEKHGIEIAKLDSDPLLKMRNDPMTLVAVVYLICRDQIEKLELSEREFAKALPFPPDPMLEAVRDSIIGFFPTGRASHVREVLAKFDEVASKTDDLATAKMSQILADPRTSELIGKKADQEIASAMEALFASTPEVGT